MTRHNAHAFLLRPIPFALLTTAACVCTALDSAVAASLPQSGHFVAGAGQICTSPSGLDISQSTARGIINWKSFSIGNGRTVYINNGSGATLNRVTGKDLSLIEGQLKATGSVYLINPQGIVVGPHGTISTGGRFVASTLDTGNSDFMNSANSTFTGSSGASVVNLGKISATGGDVFLISRKLVANDGSITAAKGSAELDVGSNVLLQDSSNSQQVFVDAGSKGTVVNAGSIRAAQISLQAADGNIYALAAKNSALRATGTATRDGDVWLVAATGSIRDSGNIVANQADGSGGTVNATAKTLDLTGSNVKAGQWNLSTASLTIGSGNAQALSRSLSDGTTVTVSTTGTTAADGTVTNVGDLTVGSPINWKGSAALALDAAGSVTINPHVTLANRGSGDLTLRADAAGVDNGGSITNHGTIDWSRSTGLVSALYDMTGTYTPGTLKSNSHWSAPQYSGYQTQITGYQLINSGEDFNNIGANLAGNYALGVNLEFGGDPGYGSVGGTFTGQFDGMGHDIDSVFLNGSGGMFSVIGTTGVVRNLDLSNFSMQSAGAGEYGTVADVNSGLITHININVQGSENLSSGGPDLDGIGTGGIVAINNGTIADSSVSTYIGATGYVGGIASVNNGLIVQSVTSGLLTATGGYDLYGYFGGIAALNYGTITKSYSTEALSIDGYLDPRNPEPPLGGAGGLAYANHGTISQSYSNLAGGGNPSGGVAFTNDGTIAANVFWNTDTVGSALANGVSSPAVGLTSAQLSDRASFGPTWNFSANGTWALPAGASAPVLRWQLSQQ